MATIQQNAHENLEAFLKALYTLNHAGTFFPVTDITRATTPMRAYSTFPAVNMVSKSGLLFDKTLTADGWLYDGYTPVTFAKFLADFQGAAKSGNSTAIEKVVITRSKLKPYVSVNVKFTKAAATPDTPDTTTTPAPAPAAGK